MTINNYSTGIGFPGLLTIVFIVFKLLEKINWSWWWILSPLWIPAAIAIAILACLGMLFLVVFTVEKIKRKGNKT